MNLSNGVHYAPHAFCEVLVGGMGWYVTDGVAVGDEEHAWSIASESNTVEARKARCLFFTSVSWLIHRHTPIRYLKRYTPLPLLSWQSRVLKY